MAGLPEGITTALVHMDAPVSFIGDEGSLFITITPSVSLVWAATGTPVGNFVDNMVLDPGVPLEVQLPHVDQSGFQDGLGNWVTGWYYTIKVVYDKTGQRRHFPEKDFQVLSGQTEVDVALVPAGTVPTIPVIAPILPVTSIEGISGTVMLSDLGLENIDNTSDAQKVAAGPIKDALALKAGSAEMVPLYSRGSIPAWVTKPGRFNPENSTYNLSPRTLPRWAAALGRAAAGGNNAHLLVGGDSISRGAGATIPYTTGAWPSQLFAAFKKAWGDPGGLGWNTFNDEASTAADPLTVVTGFVRDGTRGLHQEARNSTAAGQTISYGPITATKFRIKYAIRTDGGSFTWALNGGAVTTVNTVGGAEAIGTVTITASTNPATHTLLISSLGANVTILAFEAVSTDTGSVKVTRGARNGAKISNFTATTNAATGPQAVWKDLAPDLVVLAMETNDSEGQTPLATYKTSVESVITGARAVNSDVLLVATIPPGNAPLAIPLASYTAVLYQLADQYDVPVLDMQHRWESYAVSNAAPYSLYTDTLHPSPKGHSDYARAVFEVVGDSWRQSAMVGLDVAQSWTAVQTFGYKGNSNEQLRIAGMDNISDIATPATAYIGPTNAGHLYISAKSGQSIYTFSDWNMQGKVFIPGNTATAAARLRGALEIEKVAAPTGNPGGLGVYLFVDPADALLKLKDSASTTEVMTTRSAVLVSPNGTRFRLGIDNDGSLTTTSL
jgi:lysophospholipase L1-like esterase